MWDCTQNTKLRRWYTQGDQQMHTESDSRQLKFLYTESSHPISRDRGNKGQDARVFSGMLTHPPPGLKFLPFPQEVSVRRKSTI